MTSFKISRRNADVALFAVFLALAIGAFLLTDSFPSPLLPGYPGSAMFPRLVLVAMGLIAVSGLVRSLLFRRTASRESDLVIPIAIFAAIVGVLAVFAALLTVLGMEVAVFSVIAGCLYFRNRSLPIAVGAGLASVVVVYVIFVQALSVHLPLTVLPRYLSGF